ncbi:MAG: ATP phosphoribosyltransferase regulatory subunit [Burkholderiaceae bacterium]|nr:ATP phosphoribosyltransferase regulatory subunit [Burkholderiaceae bacterium]
MARWLLPEGISDVLPSEALFLEQLRRSALDLYRGYGYELVVPPLLEYTESLLTGVGADLDLRTLKLVDQVSGRLLGLRADITPQVARIDAHILNRAGVVRLCYAASVLHARPLHPLATREPFVVGAELFGHPSVAADAEVLELAVRSLAAAQVQGLRFDLGHTRILRALLDIDPAAQPMAEDIVAALSAKDAAALAPLADELARPARQALRALMRLHGDERVLAAARADLPAVPAVLAALDELQHLVATLARLGMPINIDLADLHGFRYHTGATFAAYAAGWPVALARGGRYDDIGRAFGRARPATGFSIDLRELARLHQGTAPRAILAPAGDDAALAALVEQLRAAGEIVVRRLGDDERIDGLACDREIVGENGAWKLVGRG